MSRFIVANYANENDPFASEWLRTMDPTCHVDTRSITEVQASDLKGFNQCHFFAGVNGWSEALRLAGWPDDVRVWTGSVPCQPFSAAGKGLGEKDERHLWPEFFRLIRECRPPVVFGEQVASAEVVGTQLEAAFVVAVQDGDFARANKLAKRLVASHGFHWRPRWLDRVQADLAGIGYAFRFKILGAHSTAAPHIRQRVFWVADTTDNRHSQGECRTNQKGSSAKLGVTGELPDGSQGHGVADGVAKSRGDGHQGAEPTGGAEAGVRQRSAEHGVADGLGDTATRRQRIDGSTSGQGGHATQSDAVDGVGDTTGEVTRRREQRLRQVGGSGDGIAGIEERPEAWSDFHVAQCRDGKVRRISAKPMLQPLVDGVPRKMAPLVARMAELGIDSTTAKTIIRAAKRNRVGCLRGAGNAIVTQVAAEFIAAYMETRGIERKEEK